MRQGAVLSPHAGEKAGRPPRVCGVIRKSFLKDLFFELQPPDLHGHMQHQERQRREPGILQQDADNRGLLDQVERMPDNGVRAAGDQLSRLGIKLNDRPKDRSV